MPALRRRVTHPSRSVVLLFLMLILVGMLALRLRLSVADAQPADWLTALITAVSAVCVTGLVVENAGTHWSPFGQIIVLELVHHGGLMTAAALLGVWVNRALRLRARLLTQAETRSLGLGDVAGVARIVLVVSVVCETTLAAAFAVRLHTAHRLRCSDTAWSGLFQAVSAFNSAGFSLHGDSLMRYAGDAWVLLPLMLSIVIGGIGFPVLQDLRGGGRNPCHWSLYTKIRLAGSAAVLMGSMLVLLAFEWSNPRSLGPIALGDKLLSAAFASVSASTAGFNSVDIGALSHESWALHYLLMFIGGGMARHPPRQPGSS